MPKWQLYLIHHSHTDIGYTDYQEKLEAYHVDYLRQVLNILRRIDAGELPQSEGFVWQCENHWQVENFLRGATENEREAFLHYVREGRIGLSGNYLNMTELVGADVLNSRLRKGRVFAQENGLNVRSAMSADINGYAWGMPDALAENGVKRMFSALHSHHGMYPMYHNPSMFLWEGPRGGRVLMFVGEHYHFGNELGFCPNGSSTYLLYDDVRAETDRGALYRTDAGTTEAQELDVLKRRLTRYLEGLEASGYPVNVVPMMVSGVISDNAPPNERIAERVRKINALMGDLVQVRMATLDDFFDALEATGAELPVYRGDFTDWWADGVGSTPAAVKLYLEAERNYRITKKLDPEGRLSDPALTETAEQNMMLYAEHTWGYSSSISEPWNTMVASVDMKKTQFAVNANIAAGRNLSRVRAAMGEVSPSANRRHRCRIVNPHAFTVSDRATVILDHWEMLDGRMLDTHPLALRDMKTGELLPTQRRPAPRGTALETALTLDAHASVDVEVVFGAESTATLPHVPVMGADGIADIAGTVGLETPYEIDTPFFRVRTDEVKGIVSIYDKKRGRELVDTASPYGAFAGIHEVTPPGDLDQMSVRRTMGRNRCTFGTVRDVSAVRQVRIVESGAVYVVLKLRQTLNGTEFFDTYLKIYKTVPLIEARVCLHKKSDLDPENLYVALPFVTDGDNETFIGKSGCLIRPGMDQLPGTCQNFYLMKDGLIRRGRGFDLLVAVRDVPLICFGPRRAEPIRLCDGNNTALNRATPFSWVMNNFWETNFRADLGGVYEFFYTLTTVDPAEPGTQLARCEAMNEGLQVLEI